MMDYRFAALWVALGIAATANSETVLVQDGQARAAILVPAQASPVELLAARELRDHVQTMTGVTLPIATETEAPSTDGMARVAVGGTALARAAGMDPETLLREGFQIRVADGNVLVVGRDRLRAPLRAREDEPLAAENETGTLFGVYRLLHDWGVRWLWPGECGTVVPRRSRLVVGPADIRDGPRVLKRQMRNVYLNRHFAGIFVDRELMSEAELTTMRREWRLWYRRNGLGSSLHFSYGHAFTGWYDRFFAKHPDYFALWPDDSRDIAGRYGKALVKLDITNPAVIDEIMREHRRKLERHPDCSVINICPNDGSSGYCVCPKCRALDVPGAVALHKGEPPAAADRSLRLVLEPGGIARAQGFRPRDQGVCLCVQPLPPATGPGDAAPRHHHRVCRLQLHR